MSIYIYIHLYIYVYLYINIHLCANAEVKLPLLKLHVVSFQMQSCVDSSRDEMLGCTVAVTSDTVLEHRAGLQSTRNLAVRG